MAAGLVTAGGRLTPLPPPPSPTPCCWVPLLLPELPLAKITFSQPNSSSSWIRSEVLAGCAIPRGGRPVGWPPARSGPPGDSGPVVVPLWCRGNRIRVCSSRRCAIRKKICECLRARLGRSWQIRTFFIGVLVTDFWGAYSAVSGTTTMPMAARRGPSPKPPS